MPYQNDWYIEAYVVKCKFWDDVSEAELKEAGAELLDVLNASRTRLYVLVDLEEVIGFPTKFKDMINDLKAMESPQKVKMAVVLSNNKLVNFFAQLVSNTLDITSMYCKTRDEVDELFTTRLGALVVQNKTI